VELKLTKQTEMFSIGRTCFLSGRRATTTVLQWNSSKLVSRGFGAAGRSARKGTRKENTFQEPDEDLDENGVVKKDAGQGTEAKTGRVKQLKKQRPQSPFTEPVSVFKAIDSAKEIKWAKFDETLEITIITGLDPRKPNQAVKGVARLPHGTGKKIRVAVITNPTDVPLALEAGADVAGGEEVISAIQGGDVNFNTIIATPEFMPMISKIGKVRTFIIFSVFPPCNSVVCFLFMIPSTSPFFIVLSPSLLVDSWPKRINAKS
jgi:hypothetical protein